MISRVKRLKMRAFASPPKISRDTPKAFGEIPISNESENHDKLAPAKKKSKRKIRFAQVALQLGLAGHSLAGAAKPAAAAAPDMAMVFEAPLFAQTSAEDIDLAIKEVDVSQAIETFEAQEFTAEDATKSLELFVEEGQVYLKKTLSSDSDLTPEAAAKRLSDGGRIQVVLIDGSTQELSSLQDLQAFDTFHGLGLKPIAPKEVVRALQGLDLGVDNDDGLIGNERPLSAYQAYSLFTEGTPSSTGAKVKGALIGAAIVAAGLGVVAVGGGALIPGVATAVAAASPAVMAGAGVALAAGVGTGIAIAAGNHSEANPEQLEVRYGIDEGLTVKNLEHVVEVYDWLQARAANPFTEEQQDVALRHFADSVGLQNSKGNEISLHDARELLANGDDVRVPSTIPGHSDTISNLRQLQQLDTVRGSEVNPTLPEHVRGSLRFLESGDGPADGLYMEGKFEAENRLSAFDAVDLLFRERQAINVIVKGKKYDTQTLLNIQELNALMGDGVNTILPDHQFEALRLFGSDDLIVERDDATDETLPFAQDSDASPIQSVDAYEALQTIRSGRSLGVSSRQRFATVSSLDDFHELKSLEFDRSNTIVSDRDFKLLRHWEQDGTYQVDSDGQRDFAYEALQALQAQTSFGIEHRGRVADVNDVEDMVELAALETPDAGFEHSISERDYNLLQHWEKNGGYEVDGDHPEFSFEALQAIQAGRQFDINSENRLAPVSGIQDMLDLAAFENPEAGFENTIPAEEFDRLTYFQSVGGNSTTRIHGERKGRAYEGYRALRNGEAFDVSAGGVWNTVTSTQALHDLDALLGRQVNDILPQDQYDLLKHLGDAQENEGLHRDGSKLNSYSALQNFRVGRGVTYDFNGGDFGSRLAIDTPNLESMARTQEVRDNQKEYDRYAYSAEDFQDKMERRADNLPGLANDNLSYAKSKLRNAEGDLSNAQADLRDAEGDLSSARRRKSDGESDLSSAKSYLREAESMPRELSEDVEYCDDATGECWWETEYYHNSERDREISWAKGEISSAERYIRDAESDIRSAKNAIEDAEDDIDSARRAISRAKGLVSEAEDLLDRLPGYRQLLANINEGNLARSASDAKSEIARLRELNHIDSLAGNLDRQSILINNQQNRPSRPAGWVAPARKDLAQF